MARVSQTTGCWFLGKRLGRVQVRRQMAAWCSDSPMRLHTQQEIHLWDGSVSVMPQIWVWWTTQKLCASDGDSHLSLKGFLGVQMCCVLDLIQLCSSLLGLLKWCCLTLYTINREFNIQDKCLEILYCSKNDAGGKKSLLLHHHNSDFYVFLLFCYFTD